MRYVSGARWTILTAAGVALMLNQAACSLAASGLEAEAPGASCGLGSTFDFKDNFDDNMTGSQWTKSAGAGIKIIEMTREVQITSAGMINSWGSYRWNETRSLLGCHVFIEVPQVLSDTEPATVLLMLNGVNQGDELTFKQTAGTLSLIAVVGGAPPYQVDLTYDHTAHRWWRLQESDGDVYWHTSPDGREWQERTHAPTPPFADTLTVSFSAGSKAGFSGNGTAVFDNLNTPPP